MYQDHDGQGFTGTRLEKADPGLSIQETGSRWKSGCYSQNKGSSKPWASGETNGGGFLLLMDTISKAVFLIYELPTLNVFSQ